MLPHSPAFAGLCVVLPLVFGSFFLGFIEANAFDYFIGVELLLTIRIHIFRRA